MKKLANKVIFNIILGTLVITALLTSSCILSANRPPVISSFKVADKYLYPTQSTELECIAADPDGDNLTFKWYCIDGSFSGTGPIVTWKAPNALGDFPVMVIVEDSNGSSAKSTITISIVANENQGCSTCPAGRR